MHDLPDRWEDEPWPLDAPDVGASRVRNRSDTFADEVPQVADLADEAWEYALDHGVSLERALVELQDLQFQQEQWEREMLEPSTTGFRITFIPLGQDLPSEDLSNAVRQISIETSDPWPGEP